MTTQPLPVGFAETEDEASRRYQLFYRDDPLPSVPPALLNATDVLEYIRLTGMLWPFDSSGNVLADKLKFASYEVDFLGDVHYCDREGRYQVEPLVRDKPFLLPMNSIGYIWLQTHFQLPEYIALRFNLRIKHVHAGLLLGTGPMVDPGFCGRLMIPLHNLTSEDYKLDPGEGLIWVEFTKLSPVRATGTARTGTAHFPKNKQEVPPHGYFIRAREKGIAPRSSIPIEITEARSRATRAEASATEAKDAAKASEAQAQSLKTRFTLGGIVSLVALGVSISFGLYQVAALVQDTHEYLRNAQSALPKRTEEMEAQINDLKVRLEAAERKLANQSSPVVEGSARKKPIAAK